MRVIIGKTLGQYDMLQPMDTFTFDTSLSHEYQCTMNILFLCVANSARSQMAEGIARHIFGEENRIESAGSQPAVGVNPFAVEVLGEIGIDIHANRPKRIEELSRSFLDKTDLVITLCAEEVCSAWFGPAKKLHWKLPDPAAIQGSREARLAAFRETRDEIARRIATFQRPANNISKS